MNNSFEKPNSEPDQEGVQEEAEREETIERGPSIEELEVLAEIARNSVEKEFVTQDESVSRLRAALKEYRREHPSSSKIEQYENLLLELERKAIPGTIERSLDELANCIEEVGADNLTLASWYWHAKRKFDEYSPLLVQELREQFNDRLQELEENLPKEVLVSSYGETLRQEQEEIDKEMVKRLSDRAEDLLGRVKDSEEPRKSRLNELQRLAEKLEEFDSPPQDIIEEIRSTI